MSSAAQQIARALGASAAEAEAFGGWFLHMWPDGNAALAFNAWRSARMADVVSNGIPCEECNERPAAVESGGRSLCEECAP